MIFNFLIRNTSITGIIIMKRKKGKIRRLCLYYFGATLISLCYFIAAKFSNEIKVEILKVVLEVFLPCTALATVIGNIRSNREITINNYSLSKVENLQKLNEELEKSRLGNITSINISMDNDININIARKEFDSGSMFINVLNLIVIGLTVVGIIFWKEITALSLLLSLTSTSIILNNVIMELEENRNITFEYVKLENSLDSIENKINEIFEKHMTDYVKFHSLKEITGELYFILGYIKPRRIARILYDTYTFAISLIVLKLMYVNGSFYVVSLFPVILGYSNFAFGKEGAKLYRQIDTKTVKIIPHKDVYKFTKDIDQIDTLLNSNIKVDILYHRKNKIRAMIDYTKLKK